MIADEIRLKVACSSVRPLLSSLSMELKVEEVHSRDCCSLECCFAEVVYGATVLSEFRWPEFFHSVSMFCAD